MLCVRVVFMFIGTDMLLVMDSHGCSCVLSSLRSDRMERVKTYAWKSCTRLQIKVHVHS